MALSSRETRRPWYRRLLRAYHLCCAAEDVRHHRLAVPDGIWFCQFCQAVSLDNQAFLPHRPHPAA